MLEINTYDRRPFEVEAVRVTQDNLDEVAAWCAGHHMIEARGSDAVHFVHVPVIRAMNENQSKAYIGHWVLKSDRGYRVFTDKAFQKIFSKRETQEVLFEEPTPRETFNLTQH